MKRMIHNLPTIALGDTCAYWVSRGFLGRPEYGAGGAPDS